MRRVSVRRIEDLVERCARAANVDLRPDVERALRRALAAETNKRARGILEVLIENARLARRRRLPVCQDTGLPVVFVTVGDEVVLTGGSLAGAVDRGVAAAYRKGRFRRSVARHPLTRRGRAGYTPAVLYRDGARGRKVRVTVMPKGFGSENTSALTMLRPTDGPRAVADFVLETVRRAGPGACPPLVLGVGIGGTFEGAAVMAKRALCRRLDRRSADPVMRKLEKDLVKELNALGIGPMGLGGRTTCLGVSIEHAPTHIAGCPVAVNVNCHATRSKTGVL